MTIYGTAILLVCTFDLLFTTIAVEFFSAKEYHFLLFPYFKSAGIYGLLLIKLFFNACSLFLLERVYIIYYKTDTAKLQSFKNLYAATAGLYLFLLITLTIYANWGIIR